jgi:hypothetical protein
MGPCPTGKGKTPAQWWLAIIAQGIGVPGANQAARHEELRINAPSHESGRIDEYLIVLAQLSITTFWPPNHTSAITARLRGQQNYRRAGAFAFSHNPRRGQAAFLAIRSRRK